MSFNPLLIGEAAPPSSHVFASVACWLRFNPLLIGEAAPPLSDRDAQDNLTPFQSPSHRGGGAAVYELLVVIFGRLVSIPFSSGRRRRRRIESTLGDTSCSAFQSPFHRGGGAAQEEV